MNREENVEIFQNMVYTANILTAKITGITCVLFTTVVRLSFWQQRTVQTAKLAIPTTQT